jgi:hypothetical protein
MKAATPLQSQAQIGRANPIKNGLAFLFRYFARRTLLTAEGNWFQVAGVALLLELIVLKLK